MAFMLHIGIEKVVEAPELVQPRHPEAAVGVLREPHAAPERALMEGETLIRSPPDEEKLTRLVGREGQAACLTAKKVREPWGSSNGESGLDFRLSARGTRRAWYGRYVVPRADKNGLRYSESNVSSRYGRAVFFYAHHSDE